MRQLLDGVFAPLTFAVGFVEKSLDIVSEAYGTWTAKNYKNVERSSITGGLAEALLQLEPLSTPPRRSLLLSTESPWTAYFDNGTRGPDAPPVVGYLCRLLRCRGVVATWVPHTLDSETGNEKGTYGAVQFELFASSETEFLNYERTISVAYDAGKWKSSFYGTVQPYEDTEQYEKRKTIEKFTPFMLNAYCRALGINLLDDEFYHGLGTLTVKNGPPPPKEFLLAEARRRLGLQ